MDNPILFKRGTSFSLLVQIPSSIDDGFFSSWDVMAQMRKYKNDSKDGIIGWITCTWDDATKSRLIYLTCKDTSKWPIGLAELDVLFTSPDGHTVRSTTKLFDIKRGITHG